MMMSTELALAKIAMLLGTAARWNGADDLEAIANIVGQTEYSHPGSPDSHDARVSYAANVRDIAADNLGADYSAALDMWNAEVDCGGPDECEGGY